MRISLVSFAAVALVAAGVAHAQLSPDEAEARLRERQASRATTQPTTEPSEVVTLRNALAKALAEIERLKKENDALRREQIEQARAMALAKPAVPPRHFHTGHEPPEIGLSEDEFHQWAQANGLTVKMDVETREAKTYRVGPMIGQPWYFVTVANGSVAAVVNNND